MVSGWILPNEWFESDEVKIALTRFVAEDDRSSGGKERV